MIKKGSAGPVVVLLSGGMDSATALAVAHSRGHDPIYALSISYGQRHLRELKSAREVAKHYGAKFIELEVPIGKVAPSALTRRKIRVPSNRSEKEIGKGIPATYVPARNTVFLSLALALAESTKSRAIYLGINAIDYSGYPDCRPEYLRAFRRLAALATASGVTGGFVPRIEAPLLRLTKADIVRLGNKLGVPLEETWSCYRGGKRPCGKCDSCILRERGFSEASVIRGK